MKYFLVPNQIRTKCIQFYLTKFSIIRIFSYSTRLRNIEVSLYIQNELKKYQAYIKSKSNGDVTSQTIVTVLKN